MSDAAVLSLLREILAKLDDLPASIAQAIAAGERMPGTGLSRADRDALETLLPAIAGVVGELAWTVGELLAHARIDGAAPALLRAAIERAAGDMDAPGAAKRLGKLFARSDGFLLGDLLLARNGRDRQGAIWTICEFQRRGKPQMRFAR